METENPDEDVAVPVAVGQALPSQARGCIGAALGFVAFIVSPLWAVAASQSLPPGEAERGYTYYFAGLAVGVLLGLVMLWDGWRRRRNPSLRRPLKKGTFFGLWALGYSLGSFVERTAPGTVWGPLLVGMFGALGLTLIPLAFIVNPPDED